MSLFDKEYSKNTLPLPEESTNEQVTNDNDRETENDQWNYHGLAFSIISGILSEFGLLMLVPFFPKAAKEKGLNPSQVGILFAIYQICSLIVSFVAPYFNKRFGAVRVLIIANIILGISTCCMAFTGHALPNDNPTLFFWTVFFIRMAQGFAGGIVQVCVVGIALRCVPKEYIGEVAGNIEGTQVIGVILGPLIGGLIYEKLGYEAPFLIAGSLNIIFAITLLFWSIDGSVDNKAENMEEENQRESTISRLVRRPIPIIGIISVSMLSLGISFVEPTMEVFMEKPPYHMNHVEVGSLYIVIPIFFTLTASITSSIAKCIGNATTFAIGVVIYGVGFLILAPPPKFNHNALTLFAFLFQSERSMAITLAVIGMATIGIGAGLIFVPFNTLIIMEGEYLGIDPSETTDSVGAFTNIAYNSGGIVGILASGAMIQNLGFSESCTLIGYIEMALGIFNCIIVSGIYRHRRAESLLRSQDHVNTESRSLSSPLLENDIEPSSEHESCVV